MTNRSTGPADDEGHVRGKRPGHVPTIYDVARAAGVNPSTVSRALSRPGRISAATESRIRKAAEELRFRVNPSARALQTGRTNTLALIVADITNPVVFDLVRGAEAAAAVHDYTLIVAESQESGDAEADAVERLMPSVDGMVLATTRMPNDRIRAFTRQKPLVVLNRPVEGVAGVLPDVRGGVAELVRHLDDLGHVRVGFASGPPTAWISAQRWDCLRSEAEVRGIQVVDLGPTMPTIVGGRKSWERVRKSRTTAVVAFNDLIAIGIMQSAAKAGVEIPTHLSVAGFDDIFGSELIVPALTTVRAQLVRAGERAVERLLAELEGEGDNAVEPLLSTRLVARASTAAPWIAPVNIS